MSLALMDSCNPMIESLLRDNKKLRAENERLKTTLCKYQHIASPEDRKATKLLTEIERLKAELAEAKNDAGYFVGMINEMLTVDIDGPIMVALGKLADKHDAKETLPSIDEVREVIDAAMKGK